MICLHVCLCTTCIVGAHGSQSVWLHPLKLELQIVVHLHLSAETQTQGKQPILLISEPSLQVLIFNFFKLHFLCVCKHVNIYVCTCHSTHVEVRRHIVGVLTFCCRVPGIKFRSSLEAHDHGYWTVSLVSLPLSFLVCLFIETESFTLSLTVLKLTI